MGIEKSAYVNSPTLNMITTNSLLLWLILLCLATSTPPSANANTANKNPNTLSFKLLHRSTIPLFENENFQQFLENNKQLSLQDSEFYTSDPLFQATTGYVYFVNMSIGEPPVPQYLAVDTGSSMVWIDVNSRNKRYYYKPRFSSTYNIVNCSSPECSLNKIFICYFKTDKCWYKNVHGNRINYSFGFLGLERFRFSGGYLDQVLFGVATETGGLVVGSPNFNGMLGLGPQPSSLLRSFSRKKFTYCFGDIFKSSSSFLELGDIEDWYYGDNMYVPLIHDDYYRIDMDCIEFMDTCLGGFNRDIFKYDGNDPFTGVIFDTGVILTFLADEAYDALENDVARFMRSKGFVKPHYKKDTQMCYEGQREQISDFPVFSFHFVDKDVDADLRLRLEDGSLFYNIDRYTFCMTIMKSSSKGILYKYFTIIGLMAQQNHTIVFDLEASRVSIQYTSCHS